MPDKILESSLFVALVEKGVSAQKYHSFLQRYTECEISGLLFLLNNPSINKILLIQILDLLLKFSPPAQNLLLEVFSEIKDSKILVSFLKISEQFNEDSMLHFLCFWVANKKNTPAVLSYYSMLLAALCNIKDRTNNLSIDGKGNFCGSILIPNIGTVHCYFGLQDGVLKAFGVPAYNGEELGQSKPSLEIEFNQAGRIQSVKGMITPGILLKLKKKQLIEQVFPLNPNYSFTWSYVEKHVQKFNREDIREHFKGDSWLCNFVENIWEYLNGETVLSTYPWNVTLPMADICNAKCSFCSSWMVGNRWLKSQDIDQYSSLIRHSCQFGLQGHGEPLVNPEFKDICLKLKELLDPRCSVYIITNGLLLDRYISFLQDIQINSYNISLNAATPETHDSIMGLGKNGFNRIVSSIRNILALRKDVPNPVSVYLSYVVIQQNIHEIPQFIELANNLGVDGIRFRTLSPMSDNFPGLNYHLLPVYLHPHYIEVRRAAIQSIQNSKVPVEASLESWDQPIYSEIMQKRIDENPPRIYTREEAVQFGKSTLWTGQEDWLGRPIENYQEREKDIDNRLDNRYNRSPRFCCSFPYYNLNITDFSFNVFPCCYLSNVPGFEKIHLGSGSNFFNLWNSPALVGLRKRLKEGPLFCECKTCPPVK